MPPGRLVDSREFHAVAPGAREQARVFHVGVPGASVGGPRVIPGRVPQKILTHNAQKTKIGAGGPGGRRHLFSGAVGHYSSNLFCDPGAAAQQRRFK